MSYPATKIRAAWTILVARVLPVITFVGLFIVFAYRPLVCEPFQVLDDGLYLKQAEAFLRWLSSSDGGAWLGTYDPFLLSKTPLFSITLASLYSIHVPLRIFEFVGLCLVVPLFEVAVRPILRLGPTQRSLIAIMIVGIPFLSNDLRLLRSGLQAVLGTACLAASIGLSLRGTSTFRHRFYWAAAAGFLMALNYLNREETIWLLPAFAVLVGIAGVRAWKVRGVKQSLALTATALLAVSLPIAVVSYQNFKHYGVFITTTRRAPEFTRCYKVLTSIDPANRKQYIPISTTARALAYNASPTFAQFAPVLDGPPGDWLARHPGHLALNGWPADGREFFASSFEFALRQAAFDVGARDARSAELMFSAIATELQAAGKNGLLPMGNSSPSLLAAPRPGDPQEIFQSTLRSLRMLLLVQTAPLVDPPRSRGAPDDIERMRLIALSPCTPSENTPITLNAPHPIRRLRQTLYTWFIWIERSMVAASLVTSLWFLVGTVRRRTTRQPDLQSIMIAAVLYGAVVLFSTAIAVVHVLGWPIIDPGSHYSYYNAFGQVPLSIATSFGLVLAFIWSNSHKRSPDSTQVKH